MTNKDDWDFKVEDFKIVIEQHLGRQFLHEADSTIMFSGEMTTFTNANTENSDPPGLLFRISRDKAIELAHRILAEWE